MSDFNFVRDTNLSTDFTLGGVVPNEIHLDFGVESDGRLRIGTRFFGPRDVILEVNSTGAVINGDAAGAGVTVTNPSAGVYNVTAAGWDPFGVVAMPRRHAGQTNLDDARDIQYRTLSATSYEISISTGDNGGTNDPEVSEFFQIHLREYL